MRMKTHLSYVPKKLPSTPKRPKPPAIGPIVRRVLRVSGGPWDGQKVRFAHEAGKIQSIIFKVRGMRGRYVADGETCKLAIWEPFNE